MDKSPLYRLKNLNNHNIISVFKDQFKIGRATTNDLSIANNPYISSSHCIFEYDHGRLYIRDNSSNGTLINRSNKISKNDPRVEIQSGDIVHIVFRKDEPESSIFIYLIVTIKRKRKNIYLFMLDVIFQVELPIVNQIEEQSNKDLSPFDEVSYPSIPPSSPNETQENIDFSSLMNTSTDVELKPTKTKEEPRKEFAMEAGDDMEDVLTCVCCQDIMSNPISLEPCLHAFCNDCYASWEAVQRTCPKCRVKVIGKKKNFVINGILEAYLKAYPHKRPVSKQSDEHSDESTKMKPTKHEVGLDGMYLDNIQYEHDDYGDDDDMDDDDDEVSYYYF
ncbi:unnamed protein product [Rotaria sp. Silwood2]|nr:unnamed protein product [Rotaria sp. Silwood2]